MDSLRYLWKPFVSYGQERRLKKNEILFQQGERGKGFYYLKDGKINLTFVSSQGAERIVDFLFPGFLTGEPGLREDPFFTTAILEEDSILYFFSEESFRNICKDHPEAANIYMSSLIQKIRLLNETISIIHRPLEYQMAHFIHKLYYKFEDSIIPISQTSLARYIGTSRISVYKVLKDWIKEECIEISHRTIKVHDINKIKSILNGTKQL
ncbi:cAMP-binding domain of CRP or a regulatory subunit of cAMP-dependent protein kinases [Alteribacillus persepolensis]|uniref:cAMP-binding domain of CRP or a regulatory subunit of cAMP-dependent protein kinases n=1 Tax=Alteribacillus persepolensis TaxID=568899 RepID=A0A1G8J7N1_9BACI|nr:Crp/Fnr family transcriptional regulator [Alteribacillus persepolensis]SDI27278.1 cAMP-binding domain of CRP or a regulatory subunit of cAMP-dependent protein kinases [Alteribacillus persepolensis]